MLVSQLLHLERAFASCAFAKAEAEQEDMAFVFKELTNDFGEREAVIDYRFHLARKGI